MARRDYLGEFEHLVLLAVSGLESNAYGMTVRRAIHQSTGRDVSIGGVYTTLVRLEEKGFLRSWTGDATPQRGGRAKRYVEITGAGRRALAEAEVAFERMRAAAARKFVWRHA